LFPQGKDEFDDVSVSFAINYFFLYVEDKSASGLQNSQELLAPWEEPIHVFLGLNSSVCLLATIRIRGGCDDQIEEVFRILRQDFRAIPALDEAFDRSHATTEYHNAPCGSRPFFSTSFPLSIQRSR
jgi:hypothetical protein